MDLMTELPMGFGMALAQNAQALNCFSNMTKNQQQAVIEQTHTIQSKEEMQAFVNHLIQ